MGKARREASRLYDKWVLDRPGKTLAAILAVLLLFTAWIPEVRLDVSADSLTLEHDSDLEYYRDIRARYGSDDFLIVTFTPRVEMFSHATLQALGGLRDRLTDIEGVASVQSILDVPLLQSPPIALDRFPENPPTLADPATDRQMAANELTHSPLYRNRLISPQGDTCAIRLELDRDEAYLSALEQRNQLRDKRLKEGLTKTESRQLKAASQRFARLSRQSMDRQTRVIREVRAVMNDYRSYGELHLGGIPMIVADMMRFIRHDLAVFGLAVLGTLALLLAIIFRQPRWVVLPMITACATGIMTAGFLGMAGWPVTVVSSNFLPLLLIFSMSLTIHLIVRYRELHSNNDKAGQRELVRDMLHSKATPCFFTVLTTMVAFGSLMVSDIRPVIDFGWIMVFAMAASMLMAFTLFPAASMLLRPTRPPRQRDLAGRLTTATARLVDEHARVVLLLGLIIVAAGATGITRLTVENRFIDYFHSSTEIFQGMTLIDEKLGGTTPLDVIIDAPEREPAANPPDDPFPPLEQSKPDPVVSGYWFNAPKLDEVASIHQYLDALPETGKVLSLHTATSVVKTLMNKGESLDTFFLSILYQRLPQDIKDRMISPYLSDDGQQLRIAIRVYESDTGLNREKLLRKIRQHLEQTRAPRGESIHLTGMVVLYNNLLQSLFRSQVMTLGLIFAVILLTFAVLFRSFRVAAVAIVPNIIPVVLVLGLLGALGIPLDIMTITIAAISMGIAVDDTIHYIHRYRQEWSKCRDHRQAMQRTHRSTGRAIFYTTITISVGFMVMVLSNFMPSVYFGLFTAVAMLSAMLVDLTILPALLGLFRPGR